MKAENNYTTSENEEEDNDNLWWAKIVLVILIPVILGFFVSDSLIHESKILVHLTLRADCDYVIPDGFEILSDGKLFVTRHKTQLGWEYLSGEQSNIRDYTLNVSKPTYLYSECKARAYIKKFVQQNMLEDLSNFKVTNK